MIAETRSIAIIASREDCVTLTRCIASAIRACQRHATIIDVLINGNPQLAQEMSVVDFVRPEVCQLRIWRVQQGDKAHAWNEYVHRIWPGQGNAIFIDGYVEVAPDAFDTLERGLRASPNALGATGIPTSGRSAASLRELMLSEGGFHGNLNAIRADAMHSMRASGFRLPLGLYRTDSLTGALLMFGLDPAANAWNKERIAVVPDAIWKVGSMGRMTYQNIVSQWKRMLRQAQGVLENRAVREHLAVKRLAPHLLPASSQALVNGWIVEQPDQARELFRKRPLCAYAAWRMRAPRDWSATTVTPVLVTALGNPEAGTGA